MPSRCLLQQPWLAGGVRVYVIADADWLTGADDCSRYMLQTPPPPTIGRYISSEARCRGHRVTFSTLSLDIYTVSTG